MGRTILAVVASGLALAGVLAVGGAAAARLSRGMPHLGVTALGVAAVVVAGRLITAPTAVIVVAVLAVGACAGAVGWLVDRASRRARAPAWPPPLMSDVAVLGVALAVVTLLKAPAAVELPLGPLGGLASVPAAMVAAVVGLAGGAVVLSPGRVRGQPWVWTLAGGLLALVVAVASGAVTVGGGAPLPAFGLPDVVGLSLRAVAVGVVARAGGVALLGAAVVLGVGEGLLRSFTTLGEAAVLPALIVVAAGVVLQQRTTPAVASPSAA